MRPVASVVLAIAMIGIGAMASPAGVSPAAKCQIAELAAIGKYMTCIQQGKPGAEVVCLYDFRNVLDKAHWNAEFKGEPCADADVYHDYYHYVAGPWASLDEARHRLLSTLHGAEGALDCAAEANACQTDLGQCNAPVEAYVPATGQVFSYGAGSDGAAPVGPALSYTDNGDGTITDNNTKLTWERKDRAVGVHNALNMYTYSKSTPPYAMDGTVVTEFLDVLNDTAGGGANCFAGHCDWRIPNVKELLTLVNYDVGLERMISEEFNDQEACKTCSDSSCSCTVVAGGTSTTVRGAPYGSVDDDSLFYTVDFGALTYASDYHTWRHTGGEVRWWPKSDAMAFRAVRGGS